MKCNCGADNYIDIGVIEETNTRLCACLGCGTVFISATDLQQYQESERRWQIIKEHAIKKSKEEIK